MLCDHFFPLNLKLRVQKKFFTHEFNLFEKHVAELLQIPYFLGFHST
jgi:hypothetical protein